jgi:ParB-like chromosome segregation protein Spo0J
VKILNTRTTHVDPAKLVLHGANPRKGDIRAVVESFRANGFWGSVVVDERNEQVLAGNHRVMAARELGWDEIPVTYVKPDSDEHALRILLADNRTSDLGTYDNDALAQLLDHLASTDAGLAGTGYDQAALDGLLEELGQNEDDDLEMGSEDQSGSLEAAFQILITCRDETQQAELLERLNSEGIECRALIS